MIQLDILKHNIDTILDGIESIVVVDTKTTRLGDTLIVPNEYGWIYNLSYYTLSRNNPTLPTTLPPNLFFPLQEELSQYTVNTMATALGVDPDDQFTEFVHTHLHKKKLADKKPAEYIAEDIVNKGTLAGAYIFAQELSILEALTEPNNNAILDISLLIKSAQLGEVFDGKDLDAFYNQLIGTFSRVKFSVDEVIVPFFDIREKYDDKFHELFSFDSDIFWKSLWLRSASQEVLVETAITIEMLGL